MKSLTDTYTLTGGVEIPCIGFGTYRIKDGEETYNAVRDALNAGYRHIDTAAVYGNERSVGRAVRESGISREEVFVATKLWNDSHGYEQTRRAFDDSLQRLGFDYLDLYLVHWPNPAPVRDRWPGLMLETWKAMEEILRTGRVRAIGVSNFREHHLREIMDAIDVAPMVNQIELHPGYTQPETVAYCKMLDILVEGWQPLGSGKLLKDETVKRIAGKYGRTPSQVLIRWALQVETLPLPKSVHTERMEENADVFGFELSEEDMDTLTALPQTGWSGLDPDKADF